jgi:Glutamyl-tRNAGlu reductase, dimerisation domain/Shikimate / quinate 5-dehydrogenase/Porphobilinogen deaminase, dipyromethane cofactor binding domain
MLANRTGKRADEVALALRARAVPWEGLALALAEADVVASCAGVPEKLFSIADIEAAVATSGGKPLLLVDLAVPRDFDPAAAKLGAVKLLDMDDISAFVAAGVGGRRAEVPAVERIVADEVDRYSTSLAARAVAPLVSALRGRAEEIRQSELTRAESRLAQLGPLERDALENMTRRIVAKLLHDPTVNLKAAAGAAQGEALAQAFRDLFGLEAQVRLRLATRGSPLARWQVNHAASLLQAAHSGLEAELVAVTTTGDRRADLFSREDGRAGRFCTRGASRRSRGWGRCRGPLVGPATFQLRPTQRPCKQLLTWALKGCGRSPKGQP